MITLKEMRWANAFSYGPDNKINFNSDQITQLVGKNGHGKSSVALILEEILFNKNSKGIKKSDILNRYVKDKSYSIELDLDKDKHSYTIKTTRGPTQSVKLFKDGVDISSHTATGTYKSIEELIGMDHKAFSQIVYQSNASSLEFLTATDTVRKKFLIELLDLGRYSKAAEVFKEVANELSKDIAAAEAKVNTVTQWLDKYSKMDLVTKPFQEVPELEDRIIQNASRVQEQLDNLESTNKKINQNNTYKKLQSNITLVIPSSQPDTSNLSEMSGKIAVYTKEIADAVQFVKKMQALHGTCPTCLSVIDEEKVTELVIQKQTTQTVYSEKLTNLKQQVQQLQQEQQVWESAVKTNEEWEKYHRLIDPKLQEAVLDKTELEQELKQLSSTIQKTREQIKQALEYNKNSEAHNARIEAISKQLVEFTEELEEHSETLHTLSERMGVLNVLTKTFSTNGLVAYKIESLVKDLEELTNKYLIDLSDGRFQITFQVSSRDKLNVIITDNGKDIDIMALSGGERARVNAATLLAIRKLMQSLSSSRINLLILDETVEALDVDGKEKLIETLLKEDGLNTFLVSHGFTHPLLEKVYVVKQHNISKIEG